MEIWEGPKINHANQNICSLSRTLGDVVFASDEDALVDLLLEALALVGRQMEHQRVQLDQTQTAEDEQTLHHIHCRNRVFDTNINVLVFDAI